MYSDDEMHEEHLRTEDMLKTTTEVSVPYQNKSSMIAVLLNSSDDVMDEEHLDSDVASEIGDEKKISFSPLMKEKSFPQRELIEIWKPNSGKYNEIDQEATAKYIEILKTPETKTLLADEFLSKSEIFNTIGQNFLNVNNYTFGERRTAGEICHQKYRNLKLTWLAHLKSNDKKQKPPFWKDLNDIFDEQCKRKSDRATSVLIDVKRRLHADEDFDTEEIKKKKITDIVQAIARSDKNKTCQTALDLARKIDTDSSKEKIEVWKQSPGKVTQHDHIATAMFLEILKRPEVKKKLDEKHSNCRQIFSLISQEILDRSNFYFGSRDSTEVCLQKYRNLRNAYFNYVDRLFVTKTEGKRKIIFLEELHEIFGDQYSMPPPGCKIWTKSVSERTLSNGKKQNFKSKKKYVGKSIDSKCQVTFEAPKNRMNTDDNFQVLSFLRSQAKASRQSEKEILEHMSKLQDQGEKIVGLLQTLVDKVSSEK